MRRRKAAITTGICSERMFYSSDLNLFLCVCGCFYCSSSTLVGTWFLFTRSYKCLSCEGLEQGLLLTRHLSRAHSVCLSAVHTPPVFPRIKVCLHCPQPFSFNLCCLPWWVPLPNLHSFTLQLQRALCAKKPWCCLQNNGFLSPQVDCDTQKVAELLLPVPNVYNFAY